MQTLDHHLFLALFTIFLSLSTTTFPLVSARVFPNVPFNASSLIAKNAPSGPWEAFHSFIGCNRGQKCEGLSKLKNYFHRFGYIPKNAPLSTFTDDFDDTLESAIQTYQKNFNLKVTGELDKDTFQQIMLPRCGVADVINGTTIMNAGKDNMFGKNNTSHFHTVSHYTFFMGSPRWPAGSRSLTYAFLPANSLNATYKSAFARALSTWTKVTSFRFQETASYDTANIKVGFFYGEHGDGDPFDGPLGKTWAHAFAPTDGRCHFDASENWVASGDVTQSPESTAVDFESVALHEIGHLLGLNHSLVPQAVMYPTLPTRTRKVQLANDDIQGIQQLYRN